MNPQDIGVFALDFLDDLGEQFALDFLDDLGEQGEDEFVQLTVIARGASGVVYQRTSSSDTDANVLLLARAMKIEQEIDE